MPKEMLSSIHVFLGMFGIATAIWLLTELYTLTLANQTRVKIAAACSAVSIWLSFIFGGYFYVVYHAIGRGIIKAGPWPWAQNAVMEIKEHLFPLLFLSTYVLIIVLSGNLVENKRLKKLAITMTVLIIALGFLMEGFGGLVTKAIRLGLMGGK